MSLRRAHVTCIFDPNNSVFSDQIPFLASSLVRAVKELSGITVTTKPLTAQRSDKSGRTNVIKTILLIPAGVDSDETRILGSRVGLALIDFQFIDFVNSTIQELQGQPSALLECTTAVSMALKEQAPGLIVDAPEPDPIIALNFNLIQSTGSQDVFNVVPTADMLDDDIGQINYTQTPSIDIFSDGGKVTTVANFFRGTDSIFDPLKGDWELTNTGIVKPTPSTFIGVINSATKVITLEQDGNPKGVTSESGVIVNVNTIGHALQIVDFPSIPRFLFTRHSVEQVGSGSKSIQYTESPTGFTTIDDHSSSLKITNKTGGTITQGTVLGLLVVATGVIEEAFD